MSFTKFASFEVSEILDLKGSSDQQRTASLDKISDFEDYRTEDGYLYARIRAISSRVNKNHDGWPSVELAGSPQIFERHHASDGFTVEASKGEKYGFSTFLGKPIFVDHHNSNTRRARGVIVDSKLHVDDVRTASLDPYYASAPDNHKPPTWVELLLEVDAHAFPKLAKAIIDGAKNSHKGIDGFSMGCNVEMSKCSHCGNEATNPEEYCQHIRAKGAHFDHFDDKGQRTSKRSYEDCYGVQFFEISAVFDPADETALTREVRAGVLKESDMQVPCPDCQGRGIKSLPNHAWEDCPSCGGRGITGDVLPGQPRGGDGSITPGRLGPADQAGDARTPDVLEGMANRSLLPQMHQGSTIEAADNPLPQSELLRSPEQVNTLRDERQCPVCGETMDDETCPLCGFVAEPEGFDNPDLTKAQQFDNQPVPPKVPLEDTELQDRTVPNAMADVPPRNRGPIAHVTGDMARWTVLTSKVAGRINSVERPIRPGTSASTGEPQEQILSDQTKPVTSSVRTAGEFIAAAGRNSGDNMKTAEEVRTPDKNVDVTGVGGVMDDSNDAASKADAQVDVGAIGGTGVEDVGADSTQSIEETSDNAGFDTSKQIEGTPTATFGDNGTDAVTNDVFPSSEEGVKKSNDDSAYPKEDGGLAGGSATQGVKPIAEQFGERVDVLDHTTSPSNNSGPTNTWSGTDGNGVTKQVDPVTTESIATEGFGKGSSAHLFAAFKLADLEVELGLTAPDAKFDRVAQLETQEPAAVIASLDYAKRVKTAGLGRTAARTATRLPVMGRSASVAAETTSEVSDVIGDSALFMN